MYSLPIYCGDPKALVVFSFQEEAQMFLDLRLIASKDRWRVRQTSVGELVSLLYVPCSDTRKVVLDPLPEIGRPQELMEHPRRGGGQCVGGVSSRLRKLEATEFYPRYSR
jgi:hypothetical protein